MPRRSDGPSTAPTRPQLPLIAPLPHRAESLPLNQPASQSLLHSTRAGLRAASVPVNSAASLQALRPPRHSIGHRPLHQRPIAPSTNGSSQGYVNSGFRQNYSGLLPSSPGSLTLAQRQQALGLTAINGVISRYTTPAEVNIEPIFSSFPLADQPLVREGFQQEFKKLAVAGKQVEPNSAWKDQRFQDRHRANSRAESREAELNRAWPGWLPPDVRSAYQRTGIPQKVVTSLWQILQLLKPFSGFDLDSLWSSTGILRKQVSKSDKSASHFTVDISKEARTLIEGLVKQGGIGALQRAQAVSTSKQPLPSATPSPPVVPVAEKSSTLLIRPTVDHTTDVPVAGESNLISPSFHPADFDDNTDSFDFLTETPLKPVGISVDSPTPSAEHFRGLDSSNPTDFRFDFTFNPVDDTDVNMPQALSPTSTNDPQTPANGPTTIHDTPLPRLLLDTKRTLPRKPFSSSLSGFPAPRTSPLSLEASNVSSGRKRKLYAYGVTEARGLRTSRRRTEAKPGLTSQKILDQLTGEERLTDDVLTLLCQVISIEHGCKEKQIKVTDSVWFFDDKHSETLPSEIRSFNNTRLMCFPIHHSTEHWALGTLESVSNGFLFNYYDSQRLEGRYERMKSRVQQWLDQYGHKGQELDGSSKKCPEQKDGWSCGLYTVASLQTILSRVPMPDNLDVQAKQSELLSLLKKCKSDSPGLSPEQKVALKGLNEGKETKTPVASFSDRLSRCSLDELQQCLRDAQSQRQNAWENEREALMALTKLQTRAEFQRELHLTNSALKKEATGVEGDDSHAPSLESPSSTQQVPSSSVSTPFDRLKQDNQRRQMIDKHLQKEAVHVCKEWYAERIEAIFPNADLDAITAKAEEEWESAKLTLEEADDHVSSCENAIQAKVNYNELLKFQAIYNGLEREHRDWEGADREGRIYLPEVEMGEA